MTIPFLRNSRDDIGYMRFSNINNIDNLIDFLQLNAKKHKYLYHFTTVKSLESIYKHRRWRFVNAKKMNDLHEFFEKISPANLMDNLYSTCFSFGDEDNIAMWAMYGIPWEEAIRLRLKTSDILKWKKNIESTSFSADKYHNPSLQEHFSISKISFHDICYYQGYMRSRQVLSDCPYPDRKHLQECPENCSGCPPKCLRWWNQKNLKTSIVNSKSSCIIDEKLVGFIKNSAWAHENETRLMLTIKNISQQDDCLDLPVPEDLLKNMQISIGPKSILNVQKIQKMTAKYLLGDETAYDKIQNVSLSYYNQKKYLNIKRHCGGLQGYNEM